MYFLTRFLNWLAQIGSITRFNLQTLGERLGSSLSAIVGIAGVVAVLVGVLSIGQGFGRTMRASGKSDTAIVLRSGSDAEMTSGLRKEDTRLIAEMDGIARSPEGPLASAELFVIIDLPKRTTGTDANVPLRGVQAAAFEVRDELEIVEGRRFEWGRNEVIVGDGAALAFAGLDVGSEIQVGKNKWAVVGRFTAGGGLAESEIWTDAGILQSAYNRGSSFQSVHARLESPATFTAFKDALTTDPRLEVKAMRQDEYYAGQSEILESFINIVGRFIASLMALGAIFVALNTMYTSVATRTREIATLRALGFHRGPVVLSLLIESLCLALLGSLLGGGLVYLLFDGFRAATMNWTSFSQVTFAFDVTPGLLVTGSVWAMVIGLIGGLLPAIRAARMPVATALREL